jgi:hypothetical protein
MSLINDALKKADEAQKSGGAPPPPPIPMRPAKPGNSSFLPILLLGGFLLSALGVAAWLLSSWWKINREQLLAKTVVKASSPAVLPETNPPAAIPSQPANEIKELSVKESAVKEPVKEPVVKEPLVATNIVTVTNFVHVNADADSITNVAKTLAGLRLQGIFYRPPDSTALINGKFVHVGDKIQSVVVLEIEKDRVTIALSGVTNVLELK